jgi:hypothetical protein
MLFFFVGVIVVVKMEGPSYLCKTDEVGEICVNSGATGSQYWGLQGLTNNTFRVQPLGSDGKQIGEAEYTRSGLLGFLGPVNKSLYNLLHVKKLVKKGATPTLKKIGKQRGNSY